MRAGGHGAVRVVRHGADAAPAPRAEPRPASPRSAMTGRRPRRRRCGRRRSGAGRQPRRRRPCVGRQEDGGRDGGHRGAAHAHHDDARRAVPVPVLPAGAPVPPPAHHASTSRSASGCAAMSRSGSPHTWAVQQLDAAAVRRARPPASSRARKSTWTMASWASMEAIGSTWKAVSKETVGSTASARWCQWRGRDRRDGDDAGAAGPRRFCALAAFGRCGKRR